jgi:hypothetical protein
MKNNCREEMGKYVVVLRKSVQKCPLFLYISEEKVPGPRKGSVARSLKRKG